MKIKIFSLMAGLLLGGFLLMLSIQKLQAGPITDISASVSNTRYTITFTPSTTIPANGRIIVQFQHNQDFKTATPADPTKVEGTSSSISALQKSGDNGFVANVGTEISGGNAITIIADGFINPPTGRYYLTIWTENSSGTPLDGTSDHTSTYRAYYTIGTPLAIGRVLDPDGNPVEHAWVDLHNSGYHASGFWGSDDTDDQGYYAIGVLNNDKTINAGTAVAISAHAPPQYQAWGRTDELTLTYDGSTINTGDDLQFIEPTKTISGTIKYSNGTAVSNARINFWSMGGWAQATSNSNGQYTVTVKGGRWEAMPQTQEGDNWSYTMPPASASFQNNTTAESQTINFTVTRASCTVTGTVLTPNGTVPTNPDQLNVNIFAMNGPGGFGQLNANGTFSIAVPPGTYTLDVHDHNQTYSGPDIAPFSLSENETYNVGAITLINRDAVITGRAIDQNGNPVADLQLNAFRMKGAGWAQATTDSNGNFSMNVFPGEWMVNIPFWDSDDSADYVLNENIKQIKATSGQTATMTLNLVQATATLTGNIVNNNGNILNEMYGFVFADRGGTEPFMGPGLGGPVDRGQFEFNLPPGTYTVGLGPMHGSDYSAGEATTVTLTEGQTLSHNITAYTNDMTVSGTILDENGSPVTGAFMEVFATNNTGGWQSANLNLSNGTYSLSIASAVDPWNIGYFIDPSTGYFSETLTENTISGNSGDSFTKNLTIRRADATISGRVTDSNGNPMPEIFVFADNRTAEHDREEAGFMGPMFMNNNITDANGNFSISVPHGTYHVSASIPREKNPNLINPNREEITVEANGSITGVTLIFKQTDATISGQVTLDGSTHEAYVWAWSEDGGYNETETDSNGNYTLNVTQDDVWHIGVNNDIINSTNYTRSEEHALDTTDESAIEQDIALETITNGLVQPMATTFTASNAKVANLSDGSQISVPANAMATSGNVNLNASSTSEIPRTTSAKPIGTGLELTASDSSGNAITSFNSNVTVAIPYNENDLENGLVTEDDLIAAYWDENNGIWQPLDNYSIDKTNNKVTFSTSHFTTFALVSDTIAGDTADNDTVEVDGKRPKIYRWTAEKFFTLTKDIKEKIKLVAYGLHFRDNANVQIGGYDADSVRVNSDGTKITAKFTWKDVNKKYDPWRTIRVINEDGTKRKAPKKIDLRNIPQRVDSNIVNDDNAEGISNAQTILKNLGFFHHPEVTGFFGHITRQAVMDFQKAYGLSPVGIIGPQTEAKLLEVK